MDITPFVCNNTIYSYVIYAVLLVVFIEYNLFDRKLQKINEKIEDLTSKNELLVKENTDFRKEMEDKNDEIEYILCKLDQYIEKYRNLEAYIDDTIHENTQQFEEKIEESIEFSTRKLEKTHEDLSRACFSRHACVIDEIETIKTDLQENKENTRMLTNINENINDIFKKMTQKLEIINENNKEKAVVLSRINERLKIICHDIDFIDVTYFDKINELKNEQEKMNKMIYALRKYISLDVISESYNPKVGLDYQKANNDKMKLYKDEIFYNE